MRLISDGLEKYSKTDQGTLFAIPGCPMQENPLNLIPPNSPDFNLRFQVENAYGIKIHGDLCPHCTAVVEEKTIKTSKNAFLSLDLMTIVAITREEFEKFQREKRYGEFHDRIEPIFIEV